MSKINDLIKELCPDGVKFVCLDEVASLRRGSAITKKNITPGDVPVVAGGQRPAYFHSESNRSADTVVVAGSGAYAGFVSFWSVPIFVSDAFSIEPLGDEVISKYIFYILKNRQAELHNLKRGSGVPHVYSRDVARWKIPVPPLEVQKEIVRVLDSFTELEAELEARKKQYAYYRNSLMTFDENTSGVQWKTLESVCESVSAGGDLPNNYMKGNTQPTKEFPYPIYSNGTEQNALYGYSDSYKIDKKAVTISARGTIGYHAVRGEKFTPIVRLITLIPNTKIINIKFLNYALDITEIGHSGGSIPQLTVPNVKKINIPVPTLAVQERIVSILDKFEKLTNDISIGLPAEIEARRKQYEYYRNKLLTFKGLECSK